jgi:hypothetical protein
MKNIKGRKGFAFEGIELSRTPDGDGETLYSS